MPRTSPPADPVTPDAPDAGDASTPPPASGVDEARLTELVADQLRTILAAAGIGASSSSDPPPVGSSPSPPTPAPAAPASSGPLDLEARIESAVRRILGDADRDAIIARLADEVTELKNRPTVAAAAPRRPWWGAWVVGV